MKKKKLNLRDIKPNPKKEHSQNDGHNHNGSESLGKFNTYLPAIFNSSHTRNAAESTE